MKQTWVWAGGAVAVGLVLWWIFTRGGSSDVTPAGAYGFTTVYGPPHPVDDSARYGAISDIASYAFGSQRDTTLGLIQRDIEAKREDIALASSRVYARAWERIESRRASNERLQTWGDIISSGVNSVLSVFGL